MTKRLCSALLALSTAVMCLCACTAGGQVSASGAPPSGSSSAPAPSSVSQSAQEPQPQPEPETPAIVTDPSANPLTGLAKADDWPEGMRPLAVMLDNVQAALPQRGLQSADLVYEMVTEGGITRLMAVYSDYTSMPEVGPVRSARDQHVQLMFPLGAMYLHVGGSTYAKALLSQYHYEAKSLDGYFQAGALELDAQRNLTAAIEHCWFTSGELFSQAAAQYRLDTEMDGPQQAVFQFVPYVQGPRVLAGGEASQLYIRFSSYANSAFRYDAEKAQYVKSQFGAPFSVTGVAVNPTTGYTREKAAALVNEMSAAYGLDIAAAPEDIDIIYADAAHDYAGPGYNVPDAKTRGAVELLARTEGIFLDPCYTAKSFRGFCDIARELDGGAIFVHTGGTPALWTQEHLDAFAADYWN